MSSTEITPHKICILKLVELYISSEYSEWYQLGSFLIDHISVCLKYFNLIINKIEC